MNRKPVIIQALLALAFSAFLTVYGQNERAGLSGMNSSDDLYEAFRGFSLFTSLGGSDKIDELHRNVWEGITRQFTRYAQIYREFDSNWDRMHHDEGYISLYTMGMVQPNDENFIDRSVRFAAMVRCPGWCFI
jgi:hypothetical protein